MTSDSSTLETPTGKNVQVPAEAAALLANAHPGARLVMIEEMNHVFKCVASGVAAQQASYSDPSVPVAGELVDVVSTFVNSLSRES